MDTALVLSGGGAKGAYQVGVISELLSRGVDFDLISGSSIGAFNGALLAEFINKGLTNNEIARKMKQVWSELGDFLRINWSGFINNFFTPARIPSIFTNQQIRDLLEKYISSDRRFSDYTGCQLSVTGTNLNNYEITTFDFNAKISVIKAVVASMAFPVALPAVKIKGDNYIDGGTLNNAPLKEAILWGTELVYVVFLSPLSAIAGPDHPHEEKNNYSALEVIEILLDLASDKLMYGDLKNARKINKLISLLNRYQSELPQQFLKQICQLFGLKSKGNKKIINVKKIAPQDILTPPGLIGFNQIEVLKDLIRKGEKDTRKLLK